MTAVAGLREQKKRQTREALLNSAYMLFKRQGYHKTSIEDITKHANFAARTFFLHFSSKEDLLFPEVTELHAKLRDMFAHRPARTSSLHVFKLWVTDISEHSRLGNLKIEKLRRQIIDSDKSLQAREKMYLIEAETILAHEIANDIGADEDDFTPKMVAAAAFAILTTMSRDFIAKSSKKDSEKLRNKTIEFLEGGLRDISE